MRPVAAIVQSKCGKIEMRLLKAIREWICAWWDEHCAKNGR
jgi:hypothetical protein